MTEQSFVNCLRKIEVRYGEMGWHDGSEPPCLYSINRERDRLRPTSLVVSRSVWEKGPPGLVLDVVADMLPEFPILMEPFRRTEWVGLALAMEAWVATAPADEFDELEALAEARLIHEHPDRETLRLVYGISRDQTARAMVARKQAEPDSQVVTTEQAWPGTVHDGMVKLVATIDELLEAR